MKKELGRELGVNGGDVVGESVVIPASDQPVGGQGQEGVVGRLRGDACCKGNVIELGRRSWRTLSATVEV